MTQKEPVPMGKGTKRTGPNVPKMSERKKKHEKIW